MTPRRIAPLLVALAPTLPTAAQADTPGVAGTGGSTNAPASSSASPSMPTASVPAAVAGGYGPRVINYRPRVRYAWGPFGPVPIAPPLIVVGPGGGFFPPPPMAGIAPAPAAAPASPPPPEPVRVTIRPVAAPRPRDAEKAEELLLYGDRLLRAGNWARAELRYRQAMRADPGSAEPHVRLAELAVHRKDYREAAQCLRDAHTADPTWLDHPDDIQGLFPEPREFAAMISDLEAHLQAHPDDRDAWFLLGAQWFLSGRPQHAADIFLRLTDRPPDPTLAAFLERTQPNAD